MVMPISEVKIQMHPSQGPEYNSYYEGMEAQGGQLCHSEFVAVVNNLLRGDCGDG